MANHRILNIRKYCGKPKFDVFLSDWFYVTADFRWPMYIVAIVCGRFVRISGGRS